MGKSLSDRCQQGLVNGNKSDVGKVNIYRCFSGLSTDTNQIEVVVRRNLQKLNNWSKNG